MADVLRKPSFEAGVGVGYGQTRANDSFANVDATHSNSSAAAQAYLLARNPLLGAEVGYLRLPEYHSQVNVPNYPAYKGLPAGTYPQTASANQDITANGLYARLNLYGPKVLGAEPYGFYGRARVTTDNHEHAVYNNTDEADFREKTSRVAPYYGLGLNYPLTKNTNIRAEYGRIPKATSDYHTGDRDMQMGLIGLGLRF